jgi:hypothetical protein
LIWNFWKPFIGQALGGKRDMTNLNAIAKEFAVNELVMSTWMRKRSDKKFLLRGMQ